jgi:hypothetical protein
MHIGLRVKYRLFCQILMKVEFSRQIFRKHSKIKFHENPTSGSRFDLSVRTDRRDVAGRRFLLFAIAPRNGTMYVIWDELSCRHLGIGPWGLDGTSGRAVFTSFQ